MCGLTPTDLTNAMIISRGEQTKWSGKKCPYPETNSEYVCLENITANRIQALKTTPN